MTDYTDHTACGICGGNTRSSGTQNLLADGSRICCNCLDRTIVLYPEEYSEDGSRIIQTYRMVTAAQMKASFWKAHQYREELMERYGYASGAFEVREVKRLKGGFFEPELLNVFGRALYGRFALFDTVKVMGRPVASRIDAISKNSFVRPFSGKNASVLKEEGIRDHVRTAVDEGKAGILIFKKHFDIRPGDILLKL